MDLYKLAIKQALSMANEMGELCHTDLDDLDIEFGVEGDELSVWIDGNERVFQLTEKTELDKPNHAKIFDCVKDHAYEPVSSYKRRFWQAWLNPETVPQKVRELVESEASPPFTDQSDCTKRAIYITFDKHDQWTIIYGYWSNKKASVGIGEMRENQQVLIDAFNEKD